MFHGPVVLLCGPRQLVDALEGVEVVPCNFSDFGCDVEGLSLLVWVFLALHVSRCRSINSARSTVMHINGSMTTSTLHCSTTCVHCFWSFCVSNAACTQPRPEMRGKLGTSAVRDVWIVQHRKNARPKGPYQNWPCMLAPWLVFGSQPHPALLDV